MIGLTLTGDRKVLKRLAAIVPKIRRKIISTSARNAMKPMLAAARSNAPTDTGRLKRSIKLRSLKRNRSGNVGIRIATSKEWFKGDEYYAAFQEFGWKAGKRAPGREKEPSEGKRRQIPGKHFVEAAFSAYGESALQSFMSDVSVSLDRIASGG